MADSYTRSMVDGPVPDIVSVAADILHGYGHSAVAEELNAHATDTTARLPEPVRTGAKLAALSQWIDDSYPPGIIGTELHAHRRVGKLMEEAGEVAEALGGVYGENPRKGVTHTVEQLLGELLDAAVTALGAYESLTGNTGESVAALDAKLDLVLERAGLAAAPEAPTL